MKHFILFIILFISANVDAKMYKIAIIDTGIGHPKMISSLGYKSKIKLCKVGHYNFVHNNKKIIDKHGYGTHIAGTIASQIKHDNYCFVILKIYETNAVNTGYIRAIEWATALKVDAINISGGGLYKMPGECEAVDIAIGSGIAVFVAAGNEKTEIFKEGKKGNKYFPASCKNKYIVVVGNGHSRNKKTKTSNYGNVVDIFINGNRIKVFGLTLSGTSQSTAKITGRYTNFLIDYRKNKGLKNGKKNITGKKGNK